MSVAHTKPRGTASRPRVGAGLPPGLARAIGMLLLVLHAALAVWVSSRNSVSFDEGFHLSAGIEALTRQDFLSSPAQPPLPRVLAAFGALAAGARAPEAHFAEVGNERLLAEGFMRANAAHYHAVFMAARFVTTLMSVLLGFLIWRIARRWAGELAGLLALAAYTLSPEALAHASVVSVDVPTALTFLGTTLAGARFLRTGRRRDFGVLAAWWAAAFLTRFSAVQLYAVLVLLGVVFARMGRLARPRAALLGLLALPLVAVFAVDAAYLFQGVGTPLGRLPFASPAFAAAAKHFAALPSPLPAPYLLGLDNLAFLAQPGLKASYLLGRVRHAHDWRYFPIALAVKWPLGLLALLLLRVVHVATGHARRAVREITLLAPVLVVLPWSMATDLDYGVRYLLPILPPLCVWAALTAEAWGRAQVLAKPARRAAAPVWAMLAIACVALQVAETARALPYPLAFFNAIGGGPGNGDRIVNDSNVDWGQGLIALRDEMRALGIHRVLLASHGMTDPAVYGIDYTPYAGGRPDSTSDFLAVSSYFLVGLPARTMTREGSSPQSLQLDMGSLMTQEPLAKPAGCLYLFRIR